MVEMRLYVPPRHARLVTKGSSSAAAAAGSDGEEGEEAEDDRTTAEVPGPAVLSSRRHKCVQCYDMRLCDWQSVEANVVWMSSEERKRHPRCLVFSPPFCSCSWRRSRLPVALSTLLGTPLLKFQSRTACSSRRGTRAASRRIAARPAAVTRPPVFSSCADCSGRYALELHQSFLRMVGKSQEFKVLYKNIARMYFLPRPASSTSEITRSAFVISLEEPIRHGQQRYAHLIAQLEAKRDDVTFNINLSEVPCASVLLVRARACL